MALSVFNAYGSHKVQQQSTNVWMFLTYASSLLPVWVFVAKHSKDLIFDGIVYDLAVLIPYVVGTMYFTHAFHELKFINYFGLVIIVIGMILFKVR